MQVTSGSSTEALTNKSVSPLDTAAKAACIVFAILYAGAGVYSGILQAYGGCVLFGVVSTIFLALLLMKVKRRLETPRAIASQEPQVKPLAVSSQSASSSSTTTTVVSPVWAQPTQDGPPALLIPVADAASSASLTATIVVSGHTSSSSVSAPITVVANPILLLNSQEAASFSLTSLNPTPLPNDPSPQSPTSLSSSVIPVDTSGVTHDSAFSSGVESIMESIITSPNPYTQETDSDSPRSGSDTDHSMFSTRSPSPASEATAVASSSPSMSISSSSANSSVLFPANFDPSVSISHPDDKASTQVQLPGSLSQSLTKSYEIVENSSVALAFGALTESPNMPEGSVQRFINEGHELFLKIVVQRTQTSLDPKVGETKEAFRARLEHAAAALVWHFTYVAHTKKQPFMQGMYLVQDHNRIAQYFHQSAKRASSHFKSQRLTSSGIDVTSDASILLPDGHQTVHFGKLPKGWIFVKPESWGTESVKQLFMHAIDYFKTRIDHLTGHANAPHSRKEHVPEEIKKAFSALYSVIGNQKGTKPEFIYDMTTFCIEHLEKNPKSAHIEQMRQFVRLLEEKQLHADWDVRYGNEVVLRIEDLLHKPPLEQRKYSKDKKVLSDVFEALEDYYTPSTSMSKYERIIELLGEAQSSDGATPGHIDELP